MPAKPSMPFGWSENPLYAMWYRRLHRADHRDEQRNEAGVDRWSRRQVPTPSVELSLGVELAKALGVDVERAHKVVITIESSKLVNVDVAYHTTADKVSRLVGLVKRFQLREPT